MKHEDILLSEVCPLCDGYTEDFYCLSCDYSWEPDNSGFLSEEWLNESLEDY